MCKSKVKCQGVGCRKSAVKRVEFNGLMVVVCKFHLRGLNDKVSRFAIETQALEERITCAKRKPKKREFKSRSLAPSRLGFKDDKREFPVHTLKAHLRSTSTPTKP